MYTIMIVEDDEVICQSIKQHLLSWGYQAIGVKDFKNVISEFIAHQPQLVLMDISLPFFNGYHWCTEIRKISKVPIMFISSANDNMSIVMAVNMGGDDFITKPFDLNVLAVKVQAMLRRSYDFAGSSHLIEHKGAILNSHEASLFYQDEKLELTKNEFKILSILLENKQQIVSRETIMTQLWQTDCFIDDNTLTVNMTRLRKRLESIGLYDFIKTKKGIGYIID